MKFELVDQFKQSTLRFIPELDCFPNSRLQLTDGFFLTYIMQCKISKFYQWCKLESFLQTDASSN